MDSTTESERWVICPVCRQANPVGTEFCRHCWGAAIHVNSRVMSDTELARWQTRLKCRKWGKPLAIAMTGAAIVGLAVFFFLFHLTDSISRPEVSLSSSSRIGEWAMFRHDISHSGATGETAVVPQGIVKWTFPTGGAIHSSPAIAAGTVYFGSTDGRLYAVDAATGEKRWDYLVGSWIETSPSVANGIVYFGSNDGVFHAVDARTGTKLWDFPTRFPVASSPAIAGDIVYFGADDYNIYALNAKTGKKIWARSLGGSVKSPPVIAGGILFVGVGNEYFYALDPISGRTRLQFMSFASVYSAGAISNDTLYFGNREGILFAVNASARSWPREHFLRPYWVQAYLMGLPGVPRPGAQSGFLWSTKLGKLIYSSPTVAGNNLYIGADNNLVAINLQQREKLWEFKTGGLINSSPAVVNDVVYIGSNDGRLHAISATSGTKLWDIQTGGKVMTSPAVADGTVFFASEDGRLYAVK
ncbi:MAG: PQQ-binding-like beta-propeller repeat protein [Chloroflexi bacterium]|nr:PQQ-binding-like beta-propeller repeat protein [Chloroflexota bacterium]